MSSSSSSSFLTTPPSTPRQTIPKKRALAPSPIDSDDDDCTRYSRRKYTYTSSSTLSLSSSPSLLPPAPLFPPRTPVKSSSRASPSSSHMKRSPATENLFLFTRDAFLEDERRTRSWGLESRLTPAFEEGECFSSPELPASPLSPYNSEDEDMGLDSDEDSSPSSPCPPSSRRRDFAPPTRFVRPRIEKLRLRASPGSKGGKAVSLERAWSFEEQLGGVGKGIWGEGIVEGARGLGLSFV